MRSLTRSILEQVIDAASEPVMIVRLDHKDWPVVRVNPAVAGLGCDDAQSRPFAEVIESLIGRELAIDISETFRSGQESSFPVEAAGREHILTLKPLKAEKEDGPTFYAVFWRDAARGTAVGNREAARALQKARHRIRDLARDDPVTGLLNANAFREALEHDWSVATRAKGTLALIVFTLDDYDAYVQVFGRHAADSCLKRVAQTIRRCLRRASDVVASIEGARFIVLSHASDEEGVLAFAETIGGAVRDLGLHHPRSSSGRFVTVSHAVGAIVPGKDHESGGAFLDELLAAASAKR